MTPDMTWWARLADEVRAAGHGEAPIDQPLRTLRDGLGFDCATLIGGKPAADASPHPILVHLDYPSDVAQFLASTYANECPGHRYAVERRVARRFVDLPFDYRESRTYREALQPCGFHEGLTLPLGHFDDRNSRPGFLALSSTHNRPLADDARLALTMFASELAGLAAPQARGDSEPADIVVQVLGGDLKFRIGALSDCPLAPAALNRVADLCSRQQAPLHFRRRGSDGQWWLIQADSLSNGVLVRCSLTDAPSGLTPRELDVVGLASRGWPNDQIADGLGVSVRTARSHIESALAKLGVSNRTALAREACERGLDSWDAIRCALE